MNDRAWYEDVPLPQLLRETRDAYREEIGRVLADAGCDDLPRTAAAVLTGLAHGAAEPAFSPQAGVVASLGLSKQAASQLIDTLVLREYLERRIDPYDRRRMGVRLTQRGRTAASAIQTATDAIEAELARLVTAEELHGLRAGLAAYRAIRARQ
jgi:DNA-binding MarR family transcriptional regulator